MVISCAVHQRRHSESEQRPEADELVLHNFQPSGKFLPSVKSCTSSIALRTDYIRGGSMETCLLPLPSKDPRRCVEIDAVNARGTVRHNLCIDRDVPDGVEMVKRKWTANETE